MEILNGQMNTKPAFMNCLMLLNQMHFYNILDRDVVNYDAVASSRVSTCRIYETLPSFFVADDVSYMMMLSM